MTTKLVKIARWLGVLAVFAIGTSAPATTHHRPHHRRSVTSRELKGRLATVRSKKQALRSELRKTARKAHIVLAEVKSVDEHLTQLTGELVATDTRLSRSRTDERQLAAQLDAATTRIAQIKEQVRRRLRALYLRGNESVFSVLIQSRSVGDLASRGYLMRTVARQDQSLFFEYRTLREQIADRKRAQDALVVQIAGLASREATQKQALAEVREEKGEVLEGLRTQEGQLQQMIAQFEADEREIGAQIEAFERRSRPFGGRSRLPAFTGRFIKPVDGPIGDRFGMRYHPILHRVRMHEGVDIVAPMGAPIRAAADGQVISTSYMRGYGNVVILDHGGGVSTVYAHASRIFCSPGQMVRRGEVIAAVGATGLATGPHCHFEVRINGHAVDPLGHL